MALQCGIVGLPNVGKSTLFNCLSNAKAQSANFPFCTIEPNVGVITVPDERLTKLAEILSGTPYDELAADKRISTLLAQKDEYEVLVLTVSDSVKAALAGASDEDLVRAAGPWSQIEEFHGLIDLDDLLEVMRELGLLARQAVDSGHSMYVWWCA